jgi:hypothetical protein
MKLSFFIFSMAAVANAAVVQGTKKSSSSTDLIESQVILHGVVGAPSSNDIAIVGQALVSSYNDANWELGHYMTGYDVPFHLPVPEDALKQSCGGTCSDDDAAYYKSGLFLSVVTPIKQSCGGTCSDDDSSNTILTKAIKQSCGGTCSDDDAAEKHLMQESFCRKIQSSGSSYLSGAKSCSIVFVPQKKEAAPVAPVANMEAHVILQGVLESASEMDMAIIGKALVSSYNAVNWNTGFHMSDVKAPYQVAIPETVGQSCGGTCSDDDRKGNKGLFVTLVAPIKQSCGGTCSDDDATAAVLKQSCGGTCSDDDSAARNVLEESFCAKIKSSVSSNLSSAKMCAIVLVAK